MRKFVNSNKLKINEKKRNKWIVNTEEKEERN